MSTSTKLIFFCGKMASGKSTLARDLADREDAVLLVQDDLLDALFPGEITDTPGFVKCSSRLKNALTPHVCALLSKGISVVLDFPANTKAQRSWFRELIERTKVDHELHFVDASDACAKISFVSEAWGYLTALLGQRTRTSKPSMRIFSLHRRMKSSISSVMSVFRMTHRPARKVG